MNLDLAGPVQALFSNFVSALPTILTFCAVVIGGLILAPIAAAFTRTLVRKSGLETLLERLGAPQLLYRVGYRHGTASLLASTARGSIYLLTAVIAADIAGISQVSEGLNVIVGYLPQVAVAILFLMIGMWAADLARGVFAGVSKQGANSVIGTAIYYGITAITVALVADQLGLKTQLINNIILLAIAAAAAAAAIGVGLSTKPTLSNLLARNYVAQLYQRGDHIRIDGMSGIVKSHAPFALIVVDGQSTYNIPYVRLMESIVETSGTPKPLHPDENTYAQAKTDDDDEREEGDY